MLADDEHHPSEPDEWWNIETVWFAFTIPERALNCVIYLIIRPSMGVCALQINIFDNTGFEPWRARHFRSLWHLPIPPSLQHIDMSDVGFWLDVVEPLTEYHIRYQHNNASFDITWRALVHPTLVDGNHIDQFGRVVGSLILDEEQISVDCIQMRDRSWKRRSDLEGRRGAYTYALHSRENGLLMTSGYAGDRSVAPRGGGWLLRDGRASPLAIGSRSVIERGPEGQPLDLVLEGEDQDRRPFRAVGRSLSRSIMHTSGNILSWDSLVQWDLDGLQCWGEDQDVLTPETWGDFPIKL
ncbi:hypothetical protein [Sphingobium sp. Sx8-8]|uniref:hypothetical protein n=1 Tax=Sphingobium sp. Sx8-8 TaxID=2933617 RepID=UPI001F57BBA6|nr:hypothetical protein [Sphingobium sp. Sx8-8]